jgi:hypothetical protein
MIGELPTVEGAVHWTVACPLLPTPATLVGALGAPGGVTTVTVHVFVASCVLPGSLVTVARTLAEPGAAQVRS